MATLLETVVSNTLAAGLLAVLAFAASRWRRPALAHGLWLLVLLKMATPPLLPVYLPTLDLEPSPVGATRTSGREDSLPTTLDALSAEEISVLLAFADETADPPPAPAASIEPANTLSWQECLVPLWLGGALLWLGFTSWSVVRFQRLLRSARRAPSGLQNQARILASRLGLSRCPPVWLVPGAVSPLVWAVGAAPRLVFPSGLVDRLGTEQRVALLLHELAHVRRRDHWVRLVELIVGAIYWWHPLVWLARRELREAEEQCCDAWVVWAFGGEGQAYARALLEAVAFVSHTRCPLPAAASGIGHVSHLRRRLTMIMRGNTPRSLSALGWLVVLSLGLGLLPLAAQAQVPQKLDGDKEEIKVLKEKLRALEQAQSQKALAAYHTELAARVLEDKNANAMAAVADLKKMIEAKRAELNDLEAKLKAMLDKLDAVKGGKAKGLGAQYKLKDLKDAKGVILEVFDEKGAKDLAEAIQKAIKENQELKKLEDFKKHVPMKVIDLDLKNLQDLLKLGELHLDFLDPKQLDELKKHGIKIELDRAIEMKHAAEAALKGKVRKNEDIDARLERLMKEIEQLRREVRESKGKQAK